MPVASSERRKNGRHEMRTMQTPGFVCLLELRGSEEVVFVCTCCVKALELNMNKQPFKLQAWHLSTKLMWMNILIVPPQITDRLCFLDRS